MYFLYRKYKVKNLMVKLDFTLLAEIVETF